MNVANAASDRHEPPLDAPPALPVFPIVSAAFRDVWRQRRVVLRFGAIPFAIALVLHLGFLYLGMHYDRDPGTDLLVNAVSSAPYALFAVPLLRYLLGEHDVKFHLRWETAHSVFVTWSIVASALFTTVWNLSGQLSYASWPLMGCLGYASARCSLVLPAVAIDEYPDLGLAWSRSRHNGWNLVGIHLVVWAFAVLPMIAAASAMRLFDVDWTEAFVHLAFIMVVVIEAVSTAALAHCFYRSKSTVRSN